MNYKKDFPIFSNIPGRMPLIYLDSAATSQKPQVVIDAVTDFYTAYTANIHRGIYAIAEKATEKVEETRRKVARFINASDPSEIVFTHGTTEGINLLANGLKGLMSKSKGVLLTEFEHHSNLVPWQHYAGKQESFVSYMTVGNNGLIDERCIDQEGKIENVNTNKYSLISMAHVSNVLGTISETRKIRRYFRASDHKPIMILDAAQSAPHLKLDVQKLGVDFVAFSGHKMFSPSGVGVLWGRKNLLNTLEPLLYGSQMINEVAFKNSSYLFSPERFEPGTLALEAIIGLGAAIDYINDVGMDTIYTHEKNLTQYALSQLQNVNGLTLLGPTDSDNRIGVISFTIDGVHPHDIAQILAERNICVRAGHHCAMPLHKKFGIPASTRVSLQLYNDQQDIDSLILGLKEVTRIFSV